MKKKNHFIAYMIAIMIMLFSVPVKAQTKTGYAEWDSTNKALTVRGGKYGAANLTKRGLLRHIYFYLV